MSNAQYSKDGQDIAFETIFNVVKRFAINGYDDVPASNLKRIAARHANIHEALPMAPSPGTRKMLEYLQSNGYDWRWETKSRRSPAGPPDVDQ